MVELLSNFGDDLMVVNAARVSYGKNKGTLDAKDEKLIKYLVDHKHTSVFRHPQLQFRITCPIYTERQLRKHEIGMEVGIAPEPNSSINSISGRYVDFSDSYYKIGQFRTQSKDSKQGSGGNLDDRDNANAVGIQDRVIDYCKSAYEHLLQLGVAKEQARSVLPLSLNTTFIWTGSFLSFIHLFGLRLKTDTQQETREVAQKMLQAVKDIEGNPFELSLKAFNL